MEYQRFAMSLLWWKSKRRKRKFFAAEKKTIFESFVRSKYSISSFIIHSLILASLVADICFACGPGRGGIRRRGPRKLTPLVYRQHIPNYSERSLAASGLTHGSIDRRDEKFRKLVVNYNPDVIFKDEENTGADRLMTQRCKEKLNTLAISVMNQWPGIRLRVTEAWDEDNHHADNSLHYEGRAIDITTSDRDRRKYGLLARLAVESGFDWVYYESRAHVHASCKSEATHPSKSGGCFTGSNTVMLEDGERKKMADLRVGDSVLTVDGNGDYKFSPVILFLDRAPEESRQFYVIHTDSGHSLTLTPSHLIYSKYQTEDKKSVYSSDTMNSVPRTNIINNDPYSADNLEEFQAVYASNVQEGDFVLVFDSQKGLKPSRVLNIETKIHTGVYAPLTSQGNLVVDDVLVSCYALIDSQTIAHMAFAPLRLWDTVLQFLPYTKSDYEDDSVFNENGIHWYANDLYSIAEKIMPSKLWTK